MKKRPYFHQVRKNCLQSNQLVHVLPEATSNMIQAGHVIGSIARAIEELVRNSILHGQATKVTIILGSGSYLEVIDDGSGIDLDAMKNFIGTDHCSSGMEEEISSNLYGGLTGFLGRACTIRGESLKALANLCRKMCINSTVSLGRRSHSHEHDLKHTRNMTIKKNVNNKIVSGRDLLVSSEKVIKEGESFSFQCSNGKCVPKSEGRSSNQSISLPTTGTTVRLYGLFRKNLVRRKHHDMKKENTYQAEMVQARSCIQMLALAYPEVTLRLQHEKVGVIELEWTADFFSNCHRFPLDSSSFECANSKRYTSNYAVILASRLRQLCGNENLKKESISTITYEEKIEEFQKYALSNSSSKIRIKPTLCTATRRYKGIPSETNKWRMIGVFCSLSRRVEEEMTCNFRTRQNEYVFINGIPAKRSPSFSSILQSAFVKGKLNIGNDLYFIIHIFCPNNETELIIDEHRSTLNCLQKDKLCTFLEKSILFINNKNKVRKSNNGELDENKEKESKKYKTSHHIPSRVISSKYIRFSNTKIPLRGKQDIQNWGEKSSSTFVNAFLNENLSQTTVNTDIPEKSINFEDAFLGTINDNLRIKFEESPRDKNNKDIKLDHMIWTRNRLKIIESSISDLAEESVKSVNLTKEMLSKAKVVGQFDKKFIIILIGDLLCAVDQHACDERIGLERLEKVLYEKTSGLNRKDKYFIDLSKLSGISSENLIKPLDLMPGEAHSLSTTQFSLVKQHKDILNKWNFSFEITNDKRKEILLTGVPNTCNKTANLTDFLQLLKDLENRYSDARLVKPTFVKRVLSSHACRYAIMFGDELTHDHCSELISSLSLCKLSFICAHGRPSVAPLLHLNGLHDHNKNVQLHNNDLTNEDTSNTLVKRQSPYFQKEP